MVLSKIDETNSRRIFMRIKIGMVGTSQLSFPGPKEETYAKLSEQMKVNAQNMNFDLVIWPKQVITEADAREAVAFFEAEKIDLLMLLNVSYSAGFLVPIFYRMKGVAIGIWSIPEPKKGPVMFNSFCSNNMYQGINDKYLRDYHIKSKWFYGNADDERFVRRLSVTVKALRAIKKLKNSRVALVGGFAPGFYDLYFDERSVYSKLDGIYINRLHEYDEIIKRADKVTDNDIVDRIKYLGQNNNDCISFFRYADILHIEKLHKC
jgi:L-fucose isomerase-like protein